MNNTSAPFSSLSVLLVDDCRMQSLLGEALLSRWGIAPAIATSGEEAVAMAESQSFDLIFMDIQMPGMDGFEAARLIREMQARQGCTTPVPIVAYTAGDLPLDDDMMRRSGMNDAVQKHAGPAIMSSCLLRWCYGKFSPALAGHVRQRTDRHSSL